MHHNRVFVLWKYKVYKLVLNHSTEKENRFKLLLPDLDGCLQLVFSVTGKTEFDPCNF